MDSEEGQRFMNFYKIKQWPYVAVLDPRTGELMVEWNYSDCATYLTVLTEFVHSSSWGDEADGRPNPPPPEPKRRRLVIFLPTLSDVLFFSLFFFYIEIVCDSLTFIYLSIILRRDVNVGSKSG